jgi:hypothetical protein
LSVLAAARERDLSQVRVANTQVVDLLEQVRELSAQLEQSTQGSDPDAFQPQGRVGLFCADGGQDCHCGDDDETSALSDSEDSWSLSNEMAGTFGIPPARFALPAPPPGFEVSDMSLNPSSLAGRRR